MSKALEIATELATLKNFGASASVLCNRAALELRRLDALNAELVDACKALIAYEEGSYSGYYPMHDSYYAAVEKARSSIENAESIELCVDEGCPHAGKAHVCINRNALNSKTKREAS